MTHKPITQAGRITTGTHNDMWKLHKSDDCEIGNPTKGNKVDNNT